jgi:hypothetical protein
MEIGENLVLNNLRGRVRYIGPYLDKPGTWVGMELDAPKGKGNGEMRGKRYFECPDNHALFVRLEDAMKFRKIKHQCPSSPISKSRSLEFSTDGNDPAQFATSRSEDTLLSVSKGKSKEETLIVNIKRQSKILETFNTKNLELQEFLENLPVKQGKEIALLIQSFEKEEVKRKLSLENDLVSLENQLLDAAARYHHHLEALDHRKAEQTISLLREIESEHRNIEFELDSLISAQRVNCQAGCESIAKLTRLISAAASRRAALIDECHFLESRKKKLELELATKSPEWKDLVSLRATEADLRQKSNDLSVLAKRLNVEFEAMNEFFCENVSLPFLSSLLILRRIEAKLPLYSGIGYEALHFVELLKLVLGGHATSTSKDADFLKKLQEFESLLDSGNYSFPMDGLIRSLQEITSLQLDLTLTPHLVRMYASKVEGESKELLLSFSEMVSCTVHPILMQNEGAELICVISELRAELQKAAMGLPFSLDLYFEVMPTFLDDLMAERDVVTLFFASHREAAQKFKPVRAAQNGARNIEKEDFLAGIQVLEEEIEKQRSKFLSMRRELKDPLEGLREFEERLKILKKQRE